MEHTINSKSDNVQFRNAFNESGLLIDVEDLKKELVSKHQEFTCVGCGQKLRPRLGKIRTAHFYHQHSITCSYETYLHKLGKQLFYEEFQKRKREGLPFTLGIPEKMVCTKYQQSGRNCVSKSKDSGRLDLIANYPEIQMESKKDEFIPDILISNPELNESVFIEIVVSNAPSAQKLNAGYPIIQVKARNEDDFNFLKNGFVSEEFHQVRLHNFPINQIESQSCNLVCKITDYEKDYLNSLLWIKDSFNYHKQNSLPFYFEFPLEYSCSHFKEQFDTDCHYKEHHSSNITEIYTTANIDTVDDFQYLVFRHHSDRTKDLLLRGYHQPNPQNWLGGIIILEVQKLEDRFRKRFLNIISTKQGLFHLVTNRKGKTTTDCGGKCKQIHQFFCVKKDMGAIMPKLSLSDQNLQNDTYPYKRLIDPSKIIEINEVMFFKMVEDCLKEGIQIRNCYVCKYHGLNSRVTEPNQGSIFCKTYKKTCHSNEATICDRYRASLDSARINYQRRYYF